MTEPNAPLQTSNPLDQVDIDIKRLQRLRILQKVNRQSPLAISETRLQNQLRIEDKDLGFTKDIVRQHLAYLHDLNFVRVEVSEDNWAVIICAAGTDYLDGLGEDREGVARPRGA